jgi:hypothetical protein
MRAALFRFLVVPAQFWMYMVAFLLNVDFEHTLEQLDDEE